MKLKLTLFFSLVFHVVSMGQNYVISGKVIDNRTGNPIENAKVELTTIFEKGGKYEAFSILNDTIYALVSQTKTNMKGEFLFDSIEKAVYNLECSKTFENIGLNFERLKIDLINKDTIILQIQLPQPCKFHNKNNKKGLCPICQKKDAVIPIVYGEPTIRTHARAERKEIYLGGCIISDCQPNWYCKRDEFEF